MTPKDARTERAAVVQRIAAQFDLAGYTCAAVVYNFAKPLIAAAPELKRWPTTPQFSASRVASLVEREVYRRWLDMKGLKND